MTAGINLTPHRLRLAVVVASIVLLQALAWAEPADAPSHSAADVGSIAAHPTTKPTGSVAIRLTAASGQTASGWKLFCHRIGPGRFRDHAGLRKELVRKRTDENGRVDLEEVPLDSDLQFIATRGSIFSVGPLIHLTANDRARSVAWPIPEADVYRARLVAPDGSPAVGEKLTLYFSLENRFSFSDSFSLETDARGEFSLPLNFSVPGFYQLKLEARRDWRPAVFEITGDAPRSGQVFEVERGFVLTGRLLDSVSNEPVPDIEVYAMHDLPAYKDAPPTSPLHVIFAEAKTDKEGRFRFSTLPSGHFRLVGGSGSLAPNAFTMPVASDAPVENVIHRQR